MNGMFLIEGLLIALILICGGVAAWTDFRKSKIPNKLLIRILLPTAVLNIVYYSCYVRDSFDFYLINLGLTTVFSLAFYGFHIWAAGDSKLLFVLVFGFPARWYDFLNLGWFPAFLTFVFTFSLAFIYLAVDSVRRSIKDKSLFHLRMRLGHGWKEIVLPYFFMIANITSINILLMFITAGRLLRDRLVITAVDFMLVLIFVRWRSVLSTKRMAVITGVEWGLLVFLFGFSILPFHFSLRYLETWGLVLAVMYLRMIAEQYNYQTVNVSDIVPGMIPSAATVIGFQKSRVKGLPTCITEDLRARLTPDEVDAIRRWEHSKSGSSQIVIVRKVPFAIFIYLGFLFFLGMEVWAFWHI